ncbi:hypothetical protein GQ55_9G181800 [Panicum hallii var. hallii]|uniref:KIB1-4 beta-propeller domain-containing protein n=1 Tax=Panicum hallii var. hallii TaxID=1504633 RepID=A0A2T7C4T6_9POAL|nr:hypothetical protein GQ55_9G181800 [Panicum hallii var. hallii]
MREIRDWASLEGGLLRDIFLRLPADAEAVRFRRVCRGWRVAAGAGAPVPRPWLALQPSGDGPARHAAVVRPAARRRRVRPVRADADAAVTGEWPPASAIRGASRGWLAVDEGKRFLLRDPFSLAEVPLPAFDAGYQMFDVFLSDDPLAAPGRWMAFAFFRSADHTNFGHVLAFCRPGDAEWARFDADDDGQVGQQIRLYRGLEFFRGRAYVFVMNPGRIAVCDVEARRLVVSSVQLPLPPGGEWEWQECLVECGGDLLVVQVWRRLELRLSSYCMGGRIYRDRVWFLSSLTRVVFDAGGSGMPVASSVVASTGDYALFVAPQGHAFALPASGFPSVRPSCVYFFATDPTRRVEGMVAIDLKADRPRVDKFVRKLPLAGNWRILSWFCPRSPVLDTTPARGRR